MSKPSSKTKDDVRSRRQRNLVAKNNRNKGGYHTSNKYERKPPLRSIDCQYLAIEDALMEAGYYD